MSMRVLCPNATPMTPQRRALPMFAGKRRHMQDYTMTYYTFAEFVLHMQRLYGLQTRRRACEAAGAKKAFESEAAISASQKQVEVAKKC